MSSSRLSLHELRELLKAQTFIDSDNYILSYRIEQKKEGFNVILTIFTHDNVSGGLKWEHSKEKWFISKYELNQIKIAEKAKRIYTDLINQQDEINNNTTDDITNE